jgi:glycine/D-amino acid oxidase-like deaminating enzyme
MTPQTRHRLHLALPGAIIGIASLIRLDAILLAAALYIALLLRTPRLDLYPVPSMIVIVAPWLAFRKHKETIP